MNIDCEKQVVKTYNRFAKLPLGAIVADGWLREQLLRSKNGMGGQLDKLEPEMIATPYINYSSFDHLPYIDGPVDRTMAAGWSGEISATYWLGLIELAYTLNDDDLISKAEQWVDEALAHQEPDGYLGAYPAFTYRGADFNAWSANWCYRALLSFYEATGRKDVLEAVHRGLLWFCENWKDHKTDYVGGTLIESMVVAYAYTGDRRLVAFSEDWLNWYESHTRWQNSLTALRSDRLPYASMHTVAYGEDVKQPALIWCATGKRELLDASVNGIRKALKKIIQPTGGAGSNNEFLSPVGADTETEYCNFTTYHHTYTWMALCTGEAQWGDEMERIVFNGAQAARKKDEKAIAYFSSPNQLHATRKSSAYSDQASAGAYAPCYYVACCPAHSVCLMPEFVRSLCLRDERGELYLLAYAPATVRSSEMDFKIETLYPFRDSLTIRVCRGGGKLHLRIPSWCRELTVSLNGKPCRTVENADGFAEIEDRLCAGDAVTVRFSMEVEVMHIDDSDTHQQYPIALRRGPLVYSLPVPTRWSEWKGMPITPLPEGWSWFECEPDIPDSESRDLFSAYQNASWSKAASETLSTTDVIVHERTTSGYVWEDPPVELEVPLRQAPSAYDHHAVKNTVPYGAAQETEGDEVLCTMVPHGCTNLRITYLPRAK